MVQNFNNPHFTFVVQQEVTGVDLEILNWKEYLRNIDKQIRAPAHSLRALIQLLVAAVAPMKIYQVIHPNASYKKTPYIDLLIVISGKVNIAIAELEPVAHFAYLKDKQVTCSLHSEGSIREGLARGKAFYALNFTEDKLIYEAEGADSFPAIERAQLNTIRQSAKDKFYLSYKRAENFYECAIGLHETGSPMLIPFFLHQCVELIYRSTLLSLNDYSKKTHDLPVLIKQVRRVAPGLYHFFDLTDKEDLRLLFLLDSAYLSSRYDDDYAISDEDKTTLLERINHLLITSKEIIDRCLA